ncbi:MAG: hypothetical protein GXC73_20045 [Chitinophagaceae bacterium]|nr:hypothetical protein [Chitinophagaceae bacterium]
MYKAAGILAIKGKAAGQQDSVTGKQLIPKSTGLVSIKAQAIITTIRCFFYAPI